MSALPAAVTELADVLAAIPGVVAVVLGGSRAVASNDAESDWDLGVYYRGAIDLTALAAFGDVHPPGSWGRLMNGGAWLTIAGHEVAGQAAKALMEEAHAISCERGQWVCNEKWLPEIAGFTGAQTLFTQIPHEAQALVRWVDLVEAHMQV